MGCAVRPRDDLAAALGVAADRVRVVMHDVGGNFGTRGGFNPEFALVVWAARRVGRPVKWVCERQEAFLCDYQGARSCGRGCLDDRGRFTSVPSLHSFEGETIETRSSRRASNWMPAVIR
jgi:carbon-monoxide dehydrogenase large subunit